MASDARETQKQENGSLMVFESYIEKGKIPTIPEIVNSVYPDMPAKWYATFELQAKALKDYLGNQKQYNYSRDAGIMREIESIAAKKMGVSVKDRWNPMDVVMVKKQAEKTVLKKIVAIGNENMDKTAKLIKLNMYMKELLKEKILLGISLKEIKLGVSQAKIEESNLTKASGATFELKSGSLKCNLDMDRNGMFDTGELALDFFVDGETEIHVQARSFRYSIANTVVQTDLTPKGRQSGAKLGKASTQALDAFLRPINLARPLSPTQHREISVTGEFTASQLNYWDTLYKKIKSTRGLDIHFGNSNEAISTLIQRAAANRDTKNVLGRLTSKLVALEWVHIYQQIHSKGKFNDWLSCLYYGAKKEFSETNGPFIKIY